MNTATNNIINHPRLAASERVTFDDNEAQINPAYKSPNKRGFGHKALTRSFRATSPDKILTVYDKYQSEYEKQEIAQTARACELASKILLKKKVANDILDALHKDGISVPAPIVFALMRIAKSMKPAAMVTVKQLQDLAGEKPEKISAKWWSEGLPLIVDIAGLTVKKSKTERRFSEVFELESKCLFRAYACEKIGAPFLFLFDRLGSRLNDSDPFIERSSSGELIVHERPSQTSEGKEAARKVQQAKYLKKMEAAEQKVLGDSSSESGTDYIELLKNNKPMMVVTAIVAVLLMGSIAESQKKQNINPELQTMDAAFDINTIVNDDDFGYLENDNDD